MPRLLCWLVCMLLPLAGTLHAATLAGASLPDTYTVAGQSLALNGMGLRTLPVVNIRIYVGGLYLTQPSHDAAAIIGSPAPKVVILRFLHSGTKAQVESGYRHGEELNCPSNGCPAKDTPDLERLIAASPPVQPGDTTTYVFANGGVTVLSNGHLTVQIANPDLAYRLLLGFLGNHPPSDALKAGMLGLNR